MFYKGEVGFLQLKTRTFFILINVIILTIDLSDTKPINLAEILSHTEDINEISKRELKIKENVLDGTAKAEVSTPRTNEEILTMSMIGVGILLFFVCCGVCCKHCFCPRKSSRGRAYQQMATSERPPSVSTNTSLPGVHNMIPLRHQGFTEMLSRTSPPPPYSSNLSVRN
ncbi:unnamed protein product [Orchesella dallaii]|uniref:Uncharacterized protein n=1 Tax=Orchesella dallaii TaxID=48710 RepID=A0ABP1QT67_9HEXA